MTIILWNTSNKN